MENIYKSRFNGTIFYTLQSWLKDYFWLNSARPIISLTMILFLAAICRDARAQFTFDTSIKVDGVGFPEDLAIGDFDNNGYKDIAYVTSTDGKLHVLYNVGTYTFTTSSIDAGGINYDYSLAAADFNEDGKSDLAIVNRNNSVDQRLVILISTGTSFTKSNFSIPGPVDIYAISTEDFDNDGHADVLVPNIGQALTWYKGNGLGGFSQQTNNNIIGGNSLIVTDFNSDSKKDLAIGRGQQMDVYLSSGATLVKTTFNLGTSPLYLITTDINNDNSKDIVGSFSASGTVYIAGMTNNGAGGFSSLTLIPSSTSASSRLATADYNNDGKQDLAIATYDGKGPVFKLNTGGSYTSETFSDERVNEILNLAFADLDNDGGPELVSLSGFPSLSILKRVSGSFQLIHKEILGNEPLRGLARDVDHDGNIDLVSASISNGAATIKRGHGDLTFESNSYLLGTGYRVEYVETADFNSDGYDDLLFRELYLSGNTKVKLSLTDNQGHYQTPFEISQASGTTVTAGDFNMDGKQDFFCSTGVFIGNGAGSFSQLQLSLSALGVYPYYARIANLNNDGVPDMVVGDAGNAWTLINSGDGNFAAPVILNTTKRIARLDVGNYDTDGLTDIFTISDINTFSVFKNTGAGTFQEYTFPVQQPLTVSSVNVFTVADFNYDGRRDFAIRVDRNNTPEIAIYVQRPGNSFKLKSELLCESDGIQDMVSADLNNDGGQDLVLFSVSKGIEVFAGFFIAEPSTQAGPITILDRTDVTVKLGFVKGTGDGRIVLLRRNTFPAELPEDDVFYSAKNQFGQGATIGNNNFVVMRSNETEVTITGLQSGTDYVASVFDYREDLVKMINNYLTAPYPEVAFKTKINQTISFSPIDSKIEGDRPFQLIGQASSGLPVAFSSSSTNIVLTLSQVSILGPGPVTIVASRGGNDDYMPAPDVSRTFCVNPEQPVITITESGTQTILTSSSGSNNQWMLNGQPIPGAINASYIVESSGTYTVKVDYGGCSATSMPDIVTGIEEEVMKALVSPNPASSSLLLHRIEVREITLASTQGEQFHLPTEAHSGGSRVDVSHLSAGLYLLSTGNGVYAKVLIIR
jgi:hypothetical protein